MSQSETKIVIAIKCSVSICQFPHDQAQDCLIDLLLRVVLVFHYVLNNQSSPSPTPTSGTPPSSTMLITHQQLTKTTFDTLFNCVPLLFNMHVSMHNVREHVDVLLDHSAPRAAHLYREVRWWAFRANSRTHYSGRT